MTPSDYRVLLVEDEPHIVKAVEFVLNGQYDLAHAPSLAAARKAVKDAAPHLVVLDIGLPDGSGMTLMRDIRKNRIPCDVIMLTGTKDVLLAVEAMKLGAMDYLQKPLQKETLLVSVQKAFERRQLLDEVGRLREEVGDPFHFSQIIAESAGMKQAVSLARKMTANDSTVLITGESGTGKDLLARAIHWEGARRAGAFVAVNCAQFSGTLLESELFGHEKGAFTGATEQRKGRFELADGGTLFLDEVGNTSLDMQAKILRVVETREFERVGGQKPIKVNVRLIAATNARLEEEIKSGRFREDLYYRLNVVRIEVPPLRDRREDIEPLCRHFLGRQCARTGRCMKGITPEAMALLTAHSWKGNVRELQNLIEMTVALEDGEWVSTRYFPPHVLAAASAGKGGRPSANLLEAAVEGFERRFLLEQLRLNGWNHRQTARSLGTHRNTIENKLRKYGIEEPKTEG